MGLLIKEITERVPELYEQDGKGEDALVYAKFFTPDSSWTWYMTELDPKERIAFGYTVGLEREFGYFSIDELETATGHLGLPVERDEYFPIGELTVRDALMSPFVAQETYKTAQPQWDEKPDSQQVFGHSDGCSVTVGRIGGRWAIATPEGRTFAVDIYDKPSDAVGRAMQLGWIPAEAQALQR
ncbi:MAG: DUF2958 domain-containing protein [Coriobacteriia bacterium]|nr:DUF2958 domain-containing protein [Coriobacteriia bacterium]